MVTSDAFGRRPAGPSRQLTPSAGASPLSRSAPTRIGIPAIGVDAPVVALGLKADGTVQEPALSQPCLTSWFSGGSAPDEPGPAAFYGHVDSRASGPAVFYRLKELREGDQIQVTRQDGRVALFRVDSVEQIPKARFPTVRVYGDTDEPVIRVMTCGGEFDPVKRSYRDNVIVFGTYTGSAPVREK